jgi:putative ABC transport system permease protein
MSLWRFVVRDLRGRLGRNALTTLGIAIGVSAFVSLVALADSFTATMLAMFASRRTDISVIRTDSPDVLMSSVPESLLPRIAEVHGVGAAGAVLADMLWAEGQPASLVLGMAPGSFLLEHLRIVEGRGIERSDRDVALLGRTLAARVQKRLGDAYEVESHAFRVVGVYDAGNSLENAGAVVPLQRLQWLLSREGEVTAINVRVLPELEPKGVAEAIRAEFRGLKPVLTTDAMQANAGLELARSMAWGTSLVALFIGLIGTLNSMLMTVLERTREMGTLLAIGWRRWRICALLLGESVVLSALGGAFGVLLGAGALRLTLAHPRIAGLLTAGLSVRLAGQAMALALGLGLLGGLLPALRGSGLQPTAALRHE